uniref:Uncharacterized protein n=1 Tax=Glossina pallidipes TaxID=7398 RepID=A0A1B0ACJ7_GLOPL
MQCNAIQPIPSIIWMMIIVMAIFIMMLMCKMRMTAVYNNGYVATRKIFVESTRKTPIHMRYGNKKLSEPVQATVGTTFFQEPSRSRYCPVILKILHCPHGSPSSTFINTANVLCKPLTNAFIISHSTGVLSCLWNMNYLLPLHKNGNRPCINNSRDIAIFRVTPKLFDSFAIIYLMRFVDLVASSSQQRMLNLFQAQPGQRQQQQFVSEQRL